MLDELMEERKLSSGDIIVLTAFGGGLTRGLRNRNIIFKIFGGKRYGFEKIAKLIAESKDMELSEITMQTSFEDMELDSLDVVEVAMEIEEEFNISLDVDDSVKTVGDVVQLVESLMNR